MPTGGQHESLDEIVSHSAVVLADQIQKAAAWAKSEMDLQIEVAGALKEFARRAKITLEVHHNVTVATGRPDSVYSNVIVEYKDPGSLSGNRDAGNNKKLIGQIRQRFYDMRREENRSMNSMFGVGTDGKYFVFVRFRDEKWTDEEPLEVNRYSTERFLWALYNLGQKGKPYQPEYLHGDFGSDSLIAQEGVRTLYDEILKTENPKAQVFFSQWKILFGEVCGYDVENLSDKLKKLAEFYGVKGKPHPGQLLFALHTYYALLIKLLAAEIVSFFNPWMTRQVEKLQNATTSAKLRRELDELERGGIFHTMGITNFLEGDLFAWYLPVWSEPIEKLTRQMVQKLDDYNPGTFSEDPAQSRDLLKKLYQQLFPKSVRHDLGEYYTPDWLADHVLNELGYEGDPDKRLLDPPCGSGTFLVMAINRIRRWYDENREKCAYDEGDLLKKILANVIGFDLNPLAVMAARTNYLVAVKDLIRHSSHIEIPVYLCDSIMTPTQIGSQNAQHSFLAETGVQYDPSNPPIAVKTAAGIFLVPPEIATSREQIGKYAEVLEKCIKAGYSKQEFLMLCDDEGLAINDPETHSSLYSALICLDKDNKNGIWARIIKNNFAPLFLGKMDFVAGNPPWVTFENLPSSYRPDLIRIFDDHYGLFRATGLAARHGSSDIDISAVFPYVSAERYLCVGGKLAFVITQTLFQSTAAAGFRRFILPSGVKLGVVKVHDMSLLQPFDGATNKTAVFSLNLGRQTQFPLRYSIWKWRGKRPSGAFDLSIEEVKDSTFRQDLVCAPISSEDPTSPWLIFEEAVGPAIRKVTGRCEYHPHKGCDTSGANGIYWVEFLRDLGGGKWLIRNLGDAGRIHKFEIVERAIEVEYIYPLLRGRDVGPWIAQPKQFILCGQSMDDFAHGIPESTLKRNAPELFSYFDFKRFRKRLESRAGYTKYLLPQGEPFYALYDIKNYTAAPWKVVIREQSSEFTSAVVGEINGKLVIPDHKLSLIATDSENEASYLCGLLNSSPARFLVRSFGISTQISVSTIRQLCIPKFNSNDRTHSEIQKLSASCRTAATGIDIDKLRKLERRLDQAAAMIWEITDSELEAIQRALAET
jgi:hypothetical protein